MTALSKQRTPIFVLSTGRCGSTTLSNILNLHPAILSLSEFVSFTGIAAFHYRRPSGNRIWRVLSGQRGRTRMMLGADYDELLYPFDAAGARYTRDNIPPILCSTLPHLTDDPHSLYDGLAAVIRAHPRQSAAAHYSALFDWLCETLDRRVWIERSGASLLFASTLLREFPNAKIIHLYRDGRETAISMSQHYLFRLIANNLAAFRKLGADPYAAIAHNPKWDSIAIRLHLASRLLPGKPINPNNTAPIADFGRLWNAMIQRTQLLFSDLPRERVHHLRFEDLQADPGPHLAALIRFAGPGLNDPDWISAASKLPRPQTPRFPALPESDRERLENACRPGLLLLGYPAFRFTASRSPLPARNDTDRDAGTAMLSPVAGLRPACAGRCFATNAPNPESRSVSPRASAALTAASAAAGDSPVSPATCRTSSNRLIPCPPLGAPATSAPSL